MHEQITQKYETIIKQQNQQQKIKKISLSHKLACNNPNNLRYQIYIYILSTLIILHTPSHTYRVENRHKQTRQQTMDMQSFAADRTKRRKNKTKKHSHSPLVTIGKILLYTFICDCVLSEFSPHQCQLLPSRTSNSTYFHFLKHKKKKL